MELNKTLRTTLIVIFVIIIVLNLIWSKTKLTGTYGGSDFGMGLYWVESLRNRWQSSFYQL